MTSKKMKRKAVNAYLYRGVQKDKTWKKKRLMFYTKAMRQQLNKLEDYTVIGEYTPDEHAEIVNISPKEAWLYSIDTDGNISRKSVSLNK